MLPAETGTVDRFPSFPSFFPALKTSEEAYKAPEIFSELARKQKSSLLSNKTPFVTQRKSYSKLA